MRWIYFNIKNINFIDEILDKINIYKQYRIDKPGKDKEKGDQLNNYLFAKIHDINDIDGVKVGMKAISHVKKNIKMDIHRKRLSRKAFETKGFMARKNQGH